MKRKIIELKVLTFLDLCEKEIAECIVNSKENECRRNAFFDSLGSEIPPAIFKNLALF